MTIQRLILATTVLALLTAGQGRAVNLDKMVAFQTDKWIDLELVDGAVAVHRVRLVEAGGSLARVQSDSYHRRYQFQLEFSNNGDTDWKAKLIVEWLDKEGRVIEGLTSKMELDEKTKHGIRDTAGTVLRYGVQRAQELHLQIDLEPD